jgi:hypothetical protein
MPARKMAETKVQPEERAPDEPAPTGLAGDTDASIHARLVAVMADVRALGKNQRITEGPARFAYRGIDDVMNAVGPAFRRHGVYVTSEVISVEHAEVRTSGNKPSGACRMVVQYTFRCDAMSEDHVSTIVAAEAWDTGDRGAQKAMSVALRTALLQLLVLPTGDPDPERDSYERADYQHGRFLDQMATAKSREEAVRIFNSAEYAGASQDQLAELKAKGDELPFLAQTVRPQRQRHQSGTPADEPATGDEASSGNDRLAHPAPADDDVSANDPANGDWNPGHPPQQSDGP